MLFEVFIKRWCFMFIMLIWNGSFLRPWSSFHCMELHRIILTFFCTFFNGRIIVCVHCFAMFVSFLLSYCHFFNRFLILFYHLIFLHYFFVPFVQDSDELRNLSLHRWEGIMQMIELVALMSDNLILLSQHIILWSKFFFSFNK